MSDEELRNLEREAQISPGDEETQIKFFNARARASGQIFTIYWKIREKKTGLFSCGRLTADPYRGNSDSLFSNLGKVWSSKNSMYTFLKKGIQKKEGGLNERLKRSEIIEYQTLTLDRVITNMDEELNSLELEMLRAEKDAGLKRIKELEAKEKKLLSKAENPQIEVLEPSETKVPKMKAAKK